VSGNEAIRHRSTAATPKQTFRPGRDWCENRHSLSVPGGTDLTEGEQKQHFGLANSPRCAVCGSNRQQGPGQGTWTRAAHFSRRASRYSNTDWRANAGQLLATIPSTASPGGGWTPRKLGAVQEENGDTVIRRQPQPPFLRIVLSVPRGERTRIQQEQEVENRWVFGFDEEDARRLFRRAASDQSGWIAGILATGTQFLLERARPGHNKQLPCQELRRVARCRAGRSNLGICSGGGPAQPAPNWAFDAEFNLDLSSFNPEKHQQGTAVGRMSAPLKLRCWVHGGTPVCRLSLSDLERLPR